MCWCFGWEACRIWAPWPGIEPAPLALTVEASTPGSPGRSLSLTSERLGNRGNKPWLRSVPLSAHTQCPLVERLLPLRGKQSGKERRARASEEARSSWQAVTARSMDEKGWGAGGQESQSLLCHDVLGPTGSELQNDSRAPEAPEGSKGPERRKIPHERWGLAERLAQRQEDGGLEGLDTQPTWTARSTAHSPEPSCQPPGAEGCKKHHTRWDEAGQLWAPRAQSANEAEL